MSEEAPVAGCVKNEASKEKGKVSKHHKLSARMALQSKGGQKNNTSQQKPVEYSTNEIITSDYDSCVEAEVDAEVLGSSEVIRRTECDYNDTDSGVIENSTGLFVGTDLEDLKEVDLLESEADCNSSAERDRERVAAMLSHLDQKVEIDALPKEAFDILKMIPNGYVPLPHQVGGHLHVAGTTGFLRKVGRNDVVYKPVQQGSKGSREVMFYDMLFSTPEDQLSCDLRGLRQLIPKYYGLKDIVDRSGDIESYMKLEDIVSRFKKPCIMDVKVGKRVWDDFAKEDKIRREKIKFPAQEIIGFRLIGMRVLRGSEYVYFNKEFGRSVTVETASDALRNFFFDGQKIRKDVISNLIFKLEKYRKWVESQISFKLFATSLLIVYEGDTLESHDSLLDVRLVDFAHAYSQDTSAKTDENFLFGLTNFLSEIGKFL